MDIAAQIERRIDEALAKSGYLFSATPKPQPNWQGVYFVSSEAEYQDYKRNLVQKGSDPDYDYIFEVKPFNAFRYTPEDMEYLKSKGGVWMDRITQKYKWDDFVKEFLADAKDNTLRKAAVAYGIYIHWAIFKKVFPGEIRPSKTGSGFTTVLYPESAKTYIGKKPVDGNKHRFVLKGAKKPKDVPEDVQRAISRWVSENEPDWLMAYDVRKWIADNLPPKKAVNAQLYRGLHFYANNADDLDFVLKKTLGFGVMDFKRGTKVKVQPTVSGGIMSWSYHPLVARSFANKQEIKVMLKARIPAKQILLDSASVDFASITGGMDFSGEAEVISVGPVEAEIAFVAFDPEVKASLEYEGYQVHPQNGVVGKMKESIEELIDARLAEKALPEYTYVDSDEYKNARRVANVLDRKGFYPVGTSSGSESEYLRPDQGGKEVRVSAHPDQHNPQRKVQVHAGKQKPASAKVDFHTPPEMPDSQVGSLAAKIAKKAKEPASGTAPSKPRTDGPVVRHVRPKESIAENVNDEVSDLFSPLPLREFTFLVRLIQDSLMLGEGTDIDASWKQDTLSTLADIEKRVFAWLPGQAAVLMRELISLSIPEAGSDLVLLNARASVTTGSTDESATDVRLQVLSNLESAISQAEAILNIGVKEWPVGLDSSNDNRSGGLEWFQRFWEGVVDLLTRLKARVSNLLKESGDPIEALIDAKLDETFNMPQRRTHLQRLNKAHPDPKRSQAAKLAHQRNQGSYANARKTTQQSAQAKAYGRKLSRMAGRFSNSTGGGQKTR